MLSNNDLHESETALGSLPTMWSNLTPEEVVLARRNADSHCLNQRTGSASQKDGISTLETAAMKVSSPYGLSSLALWTLSSSCCVLSNSACMAPNCSAMSEVSSLVFGMMVAWNGGGTKKKQNNNNHGRIGA
jgi:hypothetical protein